MTKSVRETKTATLTARIGQSVKKMLERLAAEEHRSAKANNY